MVSSVFLDRFNNTAKGSYTNQKRRAYTIDLRYPSEKDNTS